MLGPVVERARLKTGEDDVKIGLAHQEGVDLMSAHECHIGWREYAAVFHGPIRTLWAASVLRSLGTISYISLLGFVRDQLTNWGRRNGHTVRLKAYSSHYNISYEIPKSQQNAQRNEKKLALLLAYILPVPVMLRSR